MTTCEAFEKEILVVEVKHKYLSKGTRWHQLKYQVSRCIVRSVFEPGTSEIKVKSFVE